MKDHLGLATWLRNSRLKAVLVLIVLVGFVFSCGREVEQNTTTTTTTATTTTSTTTTTTTTTATTTTSTTTTTTTTTTVTLPIGYFTFGSSGEADGEMYHPYGIEIDNSGNIYLADFGNNRVQKFSPSGTFLDKFGSYGSGNGEFKNPYDIAFDSLGNIYVTDYNGDRVEKFDSNHAYLGQIGIGNQSTLEGEFAYPTSLIFGSGETLYVGDWNNHRVQKFDINLNYLGKLNYNYFFLPADLVFTLVNNEIYVSNGTSGNLMRFDSTGNYVDNLSFWNDNGTNDRFSSNLHGVDVDSTGNIYVVDSGNDRIIKFDQNRNFLGKLGSSGTGEAQFDLPRGIVIDSNDDLYVVDSNNNRVHFIPKEAF